MTTGFKIIIGFIVVLLSIVLIFLKISVLTGRVEHVENSQEAFVNREAVASPSAVPTVEVVKKVFPISTKSASVK